MIDVVNIFIYGSCHVSEQLDSEETIGNGGYGVVINTNGRRSQELSGGFSNTTNVRLELRAAIEGLRQINKPSNITVYLGNAHIIDTLTRGWLEKWAKAGYKKRRHADLWTQIRTVMPGKTNTISFMHSKNVKSNPDLQIAEGLAKFMSGKQNLPTDIQKQASTSIDLFGNEEVSAEDQHKALAFIDASPILDSVCVDASCAKNPGPTEYRGVETATKRVIFERRFKEATNNIGEFLAIVHALEFYKTAGKELKVVYSDSITAISWVRKKRCQTTFEPTDDNKEVFDAIDGAVSWLVRNQCSTKILKWNTAAWGPIVADYNRK